MKETVLLLLYTPTSSYYYICCFKFISACLSLKKGSIWETKWIGFIFKKNCYISLYQNLNFFKEKSEKTERLVHVKLLRLSTLCNLQIAEILKTSTASCLLDIDFFFQFSLFLIIALDLEYGRDDLAWSHFKDYI